MFTLFDFTSGARRGFSLRGFLGELERRARMIGSQRRDAARKRREYIDLLRHHDDFLRDVGLTRDQVEEALRRL